MEQLNKLNELLNVFWLRPETALWRAIDIEVMREFEFLSPSLDLGCGDGVFSFIRSGGRFSPEFDAFQTVGNLDKFFDNVDVFDAFDEKFSALVEKKPEYFIDVGFDHKENLLKKAGALSLYRELKLGDANKGLPFDDSSFNSVFSNIVYWLDKPDEVISEISRILRPGGKACLMLPNASLPEFSFYNQLFVKTKDPRWAFLEKLDRGRFDDNIRQSKKYEEWNDIFSKSGLKIVGHNRHLSKSVIQVWDIGLRPLFPVLRKMVAKLGKEDLMEVKKEWVELFNNFLSPLVELDKYIGQGVEPGFHCYILQK